MVITYKTIHSFDNILLIFSATNVVLSNHLLYGFSENYTNILTFVRLKTYKIQNDLIYFNKKNYSNPKVLS